MVDSMVEMQSGAGSGTRQPGWVPFPWRAQLMTMRQDATNPDVFARAIEAMAAADLNMLVIEVERGLEYDSHPAVSADWAISKKTLGRLLETARGHGITCVPLLPSLSHSGYLVEAYPELAEADCTCPRREETHKVYNDLASELIELFEPGLFHIGHDEMLTAFPRHQRKSALQCPLCRGDDAAEWFRESVLRWYEWLGEQSIQTMMWADLMLDPHAFRQHYSWLGNMHAFHGGAPDHFERALDQLPRDIIMCDWHYKPSRAYPSLLYLQEKGFNVMAAAKTMNPHNAFLLARYAQRTRTPNLLGMLGTNWSPIATDTEARLLLDIQENGAVFGGADEPDLRARAEAVDARRFVEGNFAFDIDFTSEYGGTLEAAWCDEFSENALDTPGLGLGPGRRGTFCLPIFGFPTCTMEKLIVELSIDDAFPGPGRTAISVDGGRTFTYKPLERRTDWTAEVVGHDRVLWLFDICNARERLPGEVVKVGYAQCLTAISVRGRFGRRRMSRSTPTSNATISQESAYDT